MPGFSDSAFYRSVFQSTAKKKRLQVDVLGIVVQVSSFSCFCCCSCAFAWLDNRTCVLRLQRVPASYCLNDCVRHSVSASLAKAGAPQ